MLITLTTDFGLKDPFVGIMKGVIAQINPQATVVDLTHHIPPQDVFAAALILRQAVKYFPRGSIHVAVVDPGVGSRRKPLLLQVDGNYFIGPDNGLLSLACRGRRPNLLIHLSNPAYHRQPTSATFHGRDIFAPIAAHLSRGIAPAAFGETVGHFVQLAWPEVVRSERSLTGEIVYIDGFGNLCSNIQAPDLARLGKEKIWIGVGKIRLGGLAANYAAVKSGRPVALINSWGLLEIAVNKGNAAERFRVATGARVKVSVARSGRRRRS